MNKKQLESEMKLLLEQNRVLFNNCKALKKILEEKEEEYLKNNEMLIREAETLKQQLENLSTSCHIEDKNIENRPSEETQVGCCAEEDTEIPTRDSNIDDIVTENEVTITHPEQEERKKEIHIKYQGEEHFDIAAEFIGKAVVKCSEFCNDPQVIVSKVSNDIITLAFGRTEKLKGEIMEIVSADTDSGLVKAQLETKMSEFNEYLEVLRRQEGC